MVVKERVVMKRTVWWWRTGSVVEDRNVVESSGMVERIVS